VSLILSNALSAFYSPIQDCDEVFNYWEPAHYLNHGYGLQTWEYSPEYSIRSWLYIIIHAVIGKAISFFTSRKTVEFYTIRFMLALICTVCETRLYLVIQARSRAVGLLFLAIMAFSPGMFHASAAFLPSSFAMYSSMLGLAAFLDGDHQHNVTEGIMWFGIGAIIGWPFAAVLIVPFLAERAVVAIKTGQIQSTLNSIARGTIRCFIILVISPHYRLLQSLTIPDFGNRHRLILLSKIRHHTLEPSFLQHLRREGERSEHFRH
jgi:alpha-1,2-mannosyltransferase